MDEEIDRWIVRHSNDLSVHQWIRSTIRDSQQPTSPIGFLFLKFQPPPCAVLLVKPSLTSYYPDGTVKLTG